MMSGQTVSLETIPLDIPSQSVSSKDFSGDAPKQMTYAASRSSTEWVDPGASSARNVVFAAAQSVANQGATHAKTSFLEVHRYAQQNPNSVRAISFLLAIALFAFSVLGMLNVFNAVFQPYQYLFAFYNMIFAGIIIVADGNPEWFRKFWDAQEKLFSAASFLASQTGRAAFYFYVGSINLFMLPENWLWKVIYVCLGGALCFNGALMLLDSACARRRQTEEPAFVGP